jgi:hypothetical protein
MFLHSHPMSALVSMPLSRAMWLAASKLRADPWYRGAEVDALSKQEAAMGMLANQIDDQHLRKGY